MENLSFAELNELLYALGVAREHGRLFNPEVNNALYDWISDLVYQRAFKEHNGPRVIGKIELPESPKRVEYKCKACKLYLPKHDFPMMSNICHSCEHDLVVETYWRNVIGKDY